jgi:tripartite-type tricarboxylate transporter receptor subunit TctC
MFVERILPKARERLATIGAAAPVRESAGLMSKPTPTSSSCAATMDGWSASSRRPTSSGKSDGAAGAPAWRGWIRAAPDGHTLVMGGAGSHGVTPAIKRRLPFDMDRDFTAIARVAEFPLLMMVSPSLPARTLQEFIALAKARPGQLNFGSSGVGTSLHLTGEMLQLRTGIDLVHVAYRGSTGVSTALIAGEVQITFDALPAVAGLVSARSVRAIAVTTAARLPELPDVPTAAEAGLPDFVVTSWVGPFGPAGMSPATVEQLSRAFTEAALSPEGSARLRALGATPVGESAAAFDTFWRRDLARWREVVRAADVPVGDY